jgi:hypothetical protein
MITGSQEELLAAVFYITRTHKPVDVADLAMRLMAFSVESVDKGKMFFCNMASQALLRDIRAGRKWPEDVDK